VSGDAVKVVHLLMGLQPSGLERMLVSAAPYFRAVGVRSTLVSQGAEQPFASELQAAGYSVVCIPPVKTSSGRRAWASVIRHEQPDVIHIHPEQAFAAAILVGHRAAPDARIVRTVHSYFPATGWWGIKRRLQLALSERHVSATVFLNQEMAAHESGYGRSGFVIGNWVDDAFLTSGRSDRPDVDVILVGNCSQVKNHAVVLAAALQSGWTVAHIGDESETSDHERGLLEQLGAKGLLTARGVADPLPWLARAAVFAMPSLREGFPVSVGEAIAMGCVCVVSEASGLDWATGYPLVRRAPGFAQDTWIPALAEALELAFSVPSDVREGQRVSARQDLAAALGVQRYLQVYRAAPFG